MAEKAQPAFEVSDFSLCHDTPGTIKLLWGRGILVLLRLSVLHAVSALYLLTVLDNDLDLYLRGHSAMTLQ